MRKVALAILPFVVIFLPTASAITVNVSNGNSSTIGTNEISTDFGMVTGRIVFKVGNISWAPSEIWLLPQNISPEVFSKGLNQDSVIEVPSNLTSSTCRTAVYRNQTSGLGFKIYNTASTTQIFQNGTFCGLAYNGTYFVFARY